MTEIHVFSRARAEVWRPPDVPHVIISVTTPGTADASLRHNAHTRATLRLSFDDRLMLPGILFDETMATRIVETMVASGRPSPIAELLVHCEAGISRSAAIAAAIARAMLGRDDTSYFERYVPNLLVYRLVRRACAVAGVHQTAATDALARLLELSPPPLSAVAVSATPLLPPDWCALVARYGYATFRDRVRLCEPVREGAFLVWARTDDGHAFAWRVDGPTEGWGTVILSDGIVDERPQLTASALLVGWLDRSLFVPGLAL